MTPVPGMVLHLDDDEYQYGIGPIICRVTAVLGEARIAGAPGWHLRGECRPPPPTVVLRPHLRELYVKAVAVRP